MAKAMTTEDVRAMLRPEDWGWADGDYDAGYRNGKDDERAMLLEDVALPIAEERDRLAAELAEVKAMLVEMHRADVAARQWDPSGPERLHAAYNAVDALAAKYAAAEAKR